MQSASQSASPAHAPARHNLHLCAQWSEPRLRKHRLLICGGLAFVLLQALVIFLAFHDPRSAEPFNSDLSNQGMIATAALLSVMLMLCRTIRLVWRGNRSIDTLKSTEEVILNSILEGVLVVDRSGVIEATQSKSTNEVLGSEFAPGQKFFTACDKYFNVKQAKLAEGLLQQFFDGLATDKTIGSLNALDSLFFMDRLDSAGCGRRVSLRFALVNGLSPCEKLIVTAFNVSKGVELDSPLFRNQGSSESTVNLKLDKNSQAGQSLASVVRFARRSIRSLQDRIAAGDVEATQLTQSNPQVVSILNLLNDLGHKILYRPFDRELSDLKYHCSLKAPGRSNKIDPIDLAFHLAQVYRMLTLFDASPAASQTTEPVPGFDGAPSARSHRVATHASIH